MHKLLEKPNLVELPRAAIGLVYGIVEVFVRPTLEALVAHVLPTQETIDNYIKEASITYYRSEEK